MKWILPLSKNAALIDRSVRIASTIVQRWGKSKDQIVRVVELILLTYCVFYSECKDRTEALFAVRCVFFHKR